MAAGLAILEEQGPDAVTVHAVVKRARSSVGSFYARFRGKEDLLAFLAERVRDSALEEWGALIDAKPTASEGSLAESVRAAIDHLIEVRSRWDAKLAAAAGLGESEADRGGFRGRVVEELASTLLERRSEMTHPDPDVAVRVALSAVLGVIDHYGGSAPDPRVAHGVLREQCATLVISYLRPGVEISDEHVDFFDVWS